MKSNGDSETRIQMKEKDNQDLYPKTSFERRYVDQLTQRFEDALKDRTKELYFVTFTYKESNEFPLTAAKATYHLNRIHKRLLVYLCESHRYNGSSFRNVEPEIFAFLDVNGSKSKDYKLSNVPKHASRFHHHCIIVVNKAHSKKFEALTKIRLNRQFVNVHCKKTQLRTLDVQKIAETREDIYKVADYCSAYARKHANDNDALQAFPPSASEFRKQLAA